MYLLLPLLRDVCERVLSDYGESSWQRPVGTRSLRQPFVGHLLPNYSRGYEGGNVVDPGEPPVVLALVDAELSAGLAPTDSLVRFSGLLRLQVAVPETDKVRRLSAWSVFAVLQM